MRGEDGRMNELTDKQKSYCALQDFIPFGSPAQKGLISIRAGSVKQNMAALGCKC